MRDLIGEYRQHLLFELDRAASTVKTYIEVLRRMDAQLPSGLACAHTDELRDWINAGNRSKATRHLYRAAAVGFFGWATNPADPILDFDSAQLLPGIRVPDRAARPVTTQALADILARARPPYDVWFRLAAYTGARCAEIAALDRDHVTEAEVWVQGKGGKERLVPCHPLVWAAVRSLPPGPIARTALGGRADRRSVSLRGNRHLQHVLGYDDATMHMLRHWFGTHAYEASGRDIRATQDLLGHANVNTTQRYVAVAAAGRSRAVADLPAVA